MTAQVEPYLFTVDDYYRMADAGIFTEDDRVELIEGEIVRMAPIGSLHADVVDQLNRLFIEHLTRDQARVRIQNPIRLNDRTEPQPDVVLARPRPGSPYRSVHPGPRDILLVVEIADTSLAYDRDVKTRVYARAGLPEVWIVDLTTKTVEICHSPLEGAYTQRTIVGRESTIAPQAFPDVHLSVAEILD